MRKLNLNLKNTHMITQTIIPVKFESRLKELSFHELFTADVNTENRYTIPGSSNKEIYFYGVTVAENSACLTNFHTLKVFLEEFNGSFTQELSKSLHKSPYQKANNFFQINSYTNLKDLKDLSFELVRVKDPNNKCNIEIPEAYTLHYYML